MDKRMTKAENIISLHDHRIKANEDQSDRLERRLDKIEKQLLSIKHTIYGAAGILIIMEFGLLEALNLFK
jgi:hypothetical protein|tara:strand:- start:70 stop:279 length:210 start_codon:yes stop_codon:yes gene_type:complete